MCGGNVLPTCLCSCHQAAWLRLPRRPCSHLRREKLGKWGCKGEFPGFGLMSKSTYERAAICHRFALISLRKLPLLSAATLSNRLCPTFFRYVGRAGERKSYHCCERIVGVRRLRESPFIYILALACMPVFEQMHAMETIIYFCKSLLKQQKWQLDRGDAISIFGGHFVILLGRQNKVFAER